MLRAAAPFKGANSSESPKVFLLCRPSPIQQMGEGMKPVFHGAVTAFLEEEEEEEDGDLCGSVSFSSDGSREDSVVGSSSSDLTDDATSSPTGASPPATSPSHHQLDACGPLHELSSLMAHLPIKRGLSKFFSGKSQSFKSLSSVTRVEDLAKKETPYRRKMKPCKSYGGTFESYFTPGPYSKTISKKSSRGSCASLAANRSNYSGLFAVSKPPPVPVQKNM